MVGITFMVFITFMGDTGSEWKTRVFSEKIHVETIFFARIRIFLTKMRSHNFVSLNCNKINSASRRETCFGQSLVLCTWICFFIVSLHTSLQKKNCCFSEVKMIFIKSI